MRESLVVYQRGQVVFSSQGRWLYPLFELEEVIQQRGLDPSELELHDKIAGQAAAGLMIYLGIRRCHIGICSRPALERYRQAGVAVEVEELVDLIDCKTEELIGSDWSLVKIHRFLRQRAGLPEIHS